MISELSLQWLMAVMAVIAVVVFVCLFFVDAGYGKFYSSRWGLSVGNRLGWVLMEAPAFVVMALLFVLSGTRSAVAWIALMLFELHYFHRSFVFPLLLRGSSRMPLAIVAMGALFNSVNAFMQAGWLFYCQRGAMLLDGWLRSPLFWAGLLVFLAGMAINHHSDSVIRSLRKPGDSRHYLPDGGVYRYVTSANYFGELVEWTGFALLTWSASGLVFVLWTFANLAPRAARINKRYCEQFPAEMAAHPRKRLIPIVW